jgi:hypothetical protein
LEVALDDLWAEIDRRRRATRERYPFWRLGGNVLIDGTAPGLAYVFLLCISVSRSLRTKRRYREVEEMFDHLVRVALEFYLGPSSQGVRFGFQGLGDRPRGFQAALTWLGQQLGLGPGPGRRRSKRKDGGADVVVWRPFADGRDAFVTVLAQCTIQVEWRDKVTDVRPGVWRGWLDFGRDPLTCIAIPFVLPIEYDWWDEIRRTVDILLDRSRLTELVERLPRDLGKLVWKWTDAELRRMGAKRPTLLGAWRPAA